MRLLLKVKHIFLQDYVKANRKGFGLVSVSRVLNALIMILNSAQILIVNDRMFWTRTLLQFLSAGLFATWAQV